MSAVTGTPPLLRASVRHDGRRFAPWILIATGLSASSVLVYPLVFPTERDRENLAAAIGANPALGLIFGPDRDLSTVDGFNAWRSLALGGFLAALGVVLTVTRATRAQEDSGQAELLASGVMGRAARLMTAVVLGLTGSVALGLVVGAVTVLCGGAVTASLLLAATMTATGWMFTGVAAVTAQLGSDGRTANSLAVGTLGVLFALRGFAFAVEAPKWTIWVNPLGWPAETEPAVTNDWAPLGLTVGLTALLLAGAFVLQSRRDFGVGAIAARPGPARGRVRGVWRLAVRINRGPLVTWTIAFGALGLVFGYFATSVTELLAGNAAVRRVLASGATSTADLVGPFLVTVLSLIGIIAAIPGVQTVVRIRIEETEDRVEPVMATAVGRPRYYGATVLLAFGSAALYVLVAGTLVAWLAATADLGVSFGDTVRQAVATVPAVWTVVALSVAVVGARPRVSPAVWAGVLISFVLTVLGPTFDLDDWVLGISPFWHVPDTSAARVDLSGLGWIGLATGLLVAVGVVGFRRRDLAR